MTTTQLTQNRYSAETVIADVGYLRAEEEQAIGVILGDDAVLNFVACCNELHLYWQTSADTMDSAVEDVRATLREATRATGVVSPRISHFEVRQIGQ
jgi:hypothetical protein